MTGTISRAGVLVLILGVWSGLGGADSGHIFGVHTWASGANCLVMSLKPGWVVDAGFAKNAVPTGRMKNITGEGFTLIQRLDFKAWPQEGPVMPLTAPDRAQFAADCARWVSQAKPYCRHFLLGNEMEIWGVPNYQDYVLAHQEAYAAMHAANSDVIVIIGHFCSDGNLQSTIDALGPNGYDGVCTHVGNAVPHDTLDMLDRKNARPEVGVYITEWGWVGSTMEREAARANMSHLYDGIGNSNRYRERQVYCACWFCYDCMGWTTFYLPLHPIENQSFSEQTARGTAFNVYQNNPILRSNLRVIPAGNSATITWNTNHPATTQLFYRLSNQPSGQSTDRNSTLKVSHSRSISGLTPGTAYDIVPLSTALNKGDMDAPPLKMQPNSLNVQVTDISADNVTITWQTAYWGTSIVRYGHTANYGATAEITNDFFKNHSVRLTGLDPSSSYFFEVESYPQESHEWAVVKSAPGTFGTAGCNPGDADNNNFVNAQDYRAVRDNFGQQSPAAGDADCNGFVNAADYRSVRDNFGRQY